jgi:hypothetical protein
VKAQIQRLRAEVASDRRAWEVRLDELEALDGGRAAPAELAQIAVALHHAYGAIEAALVRVSRVIEGALPEGSDWHQALLESMSLAIDTVRPAVLSPESLAVMRRLLGFRHFFRHAYAVSFDAARLEELRTKAIGSRAVVGADLDRLDGWLLAVAREAQE